MNHKVVEFLKGKEIIEICPEMLVGMSIPRASAGNRTQSTLAIINFGETMKTKKFKNKKMYSIKLEIENMIQSIDFLNLSRDIALLELMIRYNDIYVLSQEGELIQEQMSQYFKDMKSRVVNTEEFYQESIKWAVEWIYELCPIEGKRNDLPSAEEVIDFICLCYAYELFIKNWFLFTKDEYDVRLSKNDVTFISKNNNERGFIQYNYWRKGIQDKLRYVKASDEYNNSKINFLKDTDKIVESLVLCHNYYFELPDEWRIHSYSLGEFKDFSSSLVRYLHKEDFKMQKQLNVKDTTFHILGRHNIDCKFPIYSKGEWVEKIKMYCSICDRDTIYRIIDDLTYKPFTKVEIAHQFFLPYGEKLGVSNKYISFNHRPERNYIGLIPKTDQKLFDKASANLEQVQINMIKEELKCFEYWIGLPRTREQDIREGIDIIIFDPKTSNLISVELKYSIPPSSASELMRHEKTMRKAEKQTYIAKEYIKMNLNRILEEYFGENAKNMTINDFETVAVVNEYIGSGMGIDKYARIVTTDHFIELMKEGMESTINYLKNGVVGDRYVDLKRSKDVFNLNNYRFKIDVFQN